ncbi:hypothetical protein KAS50_00935, partial [bacterium]|nr:hypothetical protein [bacterium]
MKIIKFPLKIIVIWSALVLCFLIISCTKNEINFDITPEELCEKMINNPALKENPSGESFCWHARVGMDQYVENYLLTKNTGWLDAGIKYYDFLIGKMDTDPDGYKGWIGSFSRRGREYREDALVGDAILLTSILDFSVLVLEDRALKDKYSRKANEYVETAKKDFVEKWDKRGSWSEDGPYGSYAGVFPFTQKGTVKEWIKSSHAGISNPFNKQMDAGQVLLRLYRITGDMFYRDKAEKIYFTVKSRFQYFDNHYCWNYWEPLVPGDVNLQRKTTLHWVGVHPYRSGYQAGEVGKIAEAYHYGIVFDELDMQ